MVGGEALERLSAEAALLKKVWLRLEADLGTRASTSPAASNAAPRLRALVEERSGGSFADVYQADAAANGATRIDQDFESEVEVEFDDETYTGDAYPAFGWACAVAKVASASERLASAWATSVLVTSPTSKRSRAISYAFL